MKEKQDGFLSLKREIEPTADVNCTLLRKKRNPLNECTCKHKIKYGRSEWTIEL